MDVPKIMEKFKEFMEANKDTFYFEDDINKLPARIGQKISEIVNDGYKFSDVQIINMVQRANYVGAYGMCNPERINNYAGIDFFVATFENENGQKRYTIVDNELNIRKESLSKLKFYEKEAKESTNYEYYNIIKDTVVPELTKNGIELTIPEAYILFVDYEPQKLKDDIEYLAKTISENMKKVVVDIDDFSTKYVEKLKIEYMNLNTTYDPSNINDIMHELCDCGKERQYNALYEVTGINYSPYNSKEANCIASAIARNISNMAKELYEKDEISLNIDEAQKLRISWDILSNIVENKNFDELENFLVHNGKPYPISLVKTIERAIEETPEKVNVTKINSELINYLTQMRKCHSELENNKLVNMAISQYITSPTDQVFKTEFRKQYLKPDFFDRLQNGETVADICNIERMTEINNNEMKAVEADELNINGSLDDILADAEAACQVDKDSINTELPNIDEQGAI